MSVLSKGMVTFTPDDFDVLTIPGLEPRMKGIIAQVRPKLAALGDLFAPELSALAGEEMYPHVAKHARRTVHPPNDTWVAWAANKRGYKMLPHFQVGMFASHLFVQFAIIYESPNKVIFAEKLSSMAEQIQSMIPDTYGWSFDHTKPESTLHGELNKEDFENIASKLARTKNSEVTIGIRIQRDDPLLADEEALFGKIRDTFETLLPIYRLSFS